MPAWLAGLLGACSLVVGVVGLVRTFATSSRENASRIAVLEMKMGMFWRLVEEHLSGMLKKPTHLEMDTLLDGLKAHTLTLEESKRLRWWLQKVYLEGEAAHTQHRLTAILVLAAVEALIYELERRPSSSP